MEMLSETKHWQVLGRKRKYNHKIMKPITRWIKEKKSVIKG